MWADEAMCRLLTSVDAMEEIMSIKRALIIPAILALSATGSVMAGSALPLASAHTPAAHVLVTASSDTPNTFYHW